MSDHENGHKSAGTKVPVFDGSIENWPQFKTKMASYLARLNLSDLLSDKGKDIVKDDATVSGDDANVVRAANKLRSDNRKAGGILLNAIQTNADKGKAAFHLIEKFHNVDDGYSGGHFHKEWHALIERCEEVEVKSKSDLKREHCNSKMKETEDPRLFIVEMERKRIKLAKKGCQIN